MTANQYSGFFADLPQEPVVQTPTASQNDYSGFFSDLPSQKPVVKESLPAQKQYGPKTEPIISKATRKIQKALTPEKDNFLFKQPEMGPSQGLMPHGQASFFATKPKEMVLGGLISILDMWEQGMGMRSLPKPGEKQGQMPSDLLKELAGITREGESTLSPQEQEEAQIFNFFANMGKPETFARILGTSEKTLGKSFLRDFTKIEGKNADKIAKLETYLKGDITEGERKSAENILANLKYAQEQQNPINVFKNIWDKTKERIKQKYDRVVNWNNVKPEDIKELQYVAKQEAAKPIEAVTAPPKPPEAVKPPEKPVEPTKPVEVTPTKPKTEIVEPEKPKETEKPKLQLYEQTLDQYKKTLNIQRMDTEEKHRGAVVKAVMRGLDIPENVLKEYDHLVAVRKQLFKKYPNAKTEKELINEIKSFENQAQLLENKYKENKINSNQLNNGKENLRFLTEITKKQLDKVKKPTTPTAPPKVEVKPEKPKEVLIPKDIQEGLKEPGIWKNEELAKKLIKTKEMAEALLSKYEDMNFDITTAIIKSGGHQKASSMDILRQKDATDAIKMLTKLSGELPPEAKVKPEVKPSEVTTQDLQKKIESQKYKIKQIEKSIETAENKIKLLKISINKKGLSFAYKIDYERQISKMLPEKIEHNKIILKEEQEKLNTLQLKLIKPSTPKKVEVKPSVPVKTESKSSGYVRKPTPVTVPEKISHLMQKIKESDAFVKDLTRRIEEDRAKYKALKKPSTSSYEAIVVNSEDSKGRYNAAKRKYEQDKTDYLLSLGSRNESIRNMIKGRNDEKLYGQRLRRDLKDLKAKKEKSKVEVPLGSPIDKSLPKQRTQPQLAETVPLQPVAGTEQAAKKSDIIKLFRKAFNDPIRLRKFKQRASGIHKMWAKVTRLLNDNDVETAAHEIGHNLHTTLYSGDALTAKEQRAKVERTLMPYLGELKPLAPYEPYTLEGFAEFTRLYVTNPDSAKKLAPKFYEKFEKDLDVMFPEAKEALLMAREYYRRYLQGTPESRVESHIAYDVDGKTDKVLDWVAKSHKIDSLVKFIDDDLIVFKRLVADTLGIKMSQVEDAISDANIYVYARVNKGAVGKVVQFLGEHTFDFNDHTKVTGEGAVPIFREVRKKADYRSFNNYLVARRVTKDMRRRGIDIGIGYTDAKKVYEAGHARWKDLAARYDSYNDRVLEYLRDSGVISTEQMQKIKSENLFYAPLNRDLGKKDTSKVGGKNLQAKNPLRRLGKKSKKDIIPPLESLIPNTASILLNAEKNRCAHVLANVSKLKNAGQFVERVPTPMEVKSKFTRDQVIEALEKHIKQNFGAEVPNDVQIMIHDQAVELADVIPDLLQRFGATTYPAGENIVTDFVDGKPEYYEVSEDIFKAWKGNENVETFNVILKVARSLSHVLRTGAIYNPSFAVFNSIKDSLSRPLFTRAGKNISEFKDVAELLTRTFIQPVQVLGQAIGKGKLWEEFMRSGAGMSTLQSLNREGAIKTVNELSRPKWMRNYLTEATRISEETNRMIEYTRLMEKYLSLGVSPELSRTWAAFGARDLSVDFNKQGTAFRVLNPYAPFSSVVEQGLSKLARTIRKPKAAQRLALALFISAVIPEALLWFANRDDEEYQELPNHEKDLFFHGRFPGGKLLRFPKAFEPVVLVTGLVRRFMDMAIKKDPHAFEGFADTLIGLATPSTIPLAIKPFVEEWANKSFFTGGKILSDKEKKLISRYQYKTSTSDTARITGRGMAYMLGNQDTENALASPIIIDHFIHSYTGGLGSIVVSAMDEARERVFGPLDQAEKPQRTFAEKAKLDMFLAKHPRSGSLSIQRFYDTYSKASKLDDTYKLLKKEKKASPQEIDALRQKIRSQYNIQRLDSTYKAMQQNQRLINNILKDKTMSAEEKRVRVDDLYTQRARIARLANKYQDDYRDFHSAKK